MLAWETILQVASVLVSIVLLWKGADWLVEAAARIARRLHVSELVIGLTLVAMGTSAPEFAVSIGAALEGHSDISVGNVVGSNIFNLGFILGGCALVRPIGTSRPLVYRDGVFLVLVTLGLAAVATDLAVSRIEGIGMFGVLVLYTGVLIWQRKVTGEPVEVETEGHEASGSVPRDLVVVALSLAAVLVGSRLLVYGATGIARSLGWSEWVIGVTVVAAGTSAPEVVTSLAAVLKGKHGISAGNLIGSDIFNLLGVLGVAAAIQPMTVDPSATGSVYVLTGTVLVTFVFMRSGWRVSRWEGATLMTIAGLRWFADMSELSWRDLFG